MTGNKGGGDLTDYARLVEQQRANKREMIERLQGLNDVARAFGLSRIAGKALRRSLAAARGRGEIDWGVSEETFQIWKANAGNAKARRRWRRKDIPNAQRVLALCRAEWIGRIEAGLEHNGDWTWAPGIWAGAPPSSPRPTSNEELAAEVASLINGEMVP